MGKLQLKWQIKYDEWRKTANEIESESGYKEQRTKTGSYKCKSRDELIQGHFYGAEFRTPLDYAMLKKTKTIQLKSCNIQGMPGLCEVENGRNHTI